MRRVFAALVTLAALAGTNPSAGAAPSTEASEARTSRATLLLRSADLTDRLATAQSAVVGAQTGQRRADGALARARDRMVSRAVRAYVRGPDAGALVSRCPRPYLEVAANKERQLLRRYRSASAAAGVEQERAEAGRAELRQASSELARVQAELGTVIAADDRRRAEEQQVRDDQQRQADEARMAAVTSGVGFSAGPAGTPSPGGYAPSPLDPHALLPRHRAATQRQLALMGRIPFGPLAPGGSLPAGLRPTGQRVVGNASWYGPGFNGRPTASGAIYDQEGWTVASKELPLGTILVVARGDRRVLLLVNDRGPYVAGRVLDLSAAGARALGLGGVGPVVAEVVGSA